MAGEDQALLIYTRIFEWWVFFVMKFMKTVFCFEKKTKFIICKRIILGLSMFSISVKVAKTKPQSSSCLPFEICGSD